MVIAEDAEDVDHRLAGLLLALALALDHAEELVEGRFELCTCRKGAGECELRTVVIGVLGCRGLEAGDVDAGRLAQPCGGLETFNVRVRHELSEDDEGILDGAVIDQQCGEARARVLVVGLLVEDLPQDVFGASCVARDEGSPGLVDHEVEPRRQDGLEEGGDLGLREGAHEPVDLLAVPDRDDRGDRLHAELGGELLVGVDVHLCELECSTGFVRHALEEGGERLARSAPRRPEVDENGDFPGSKQDLMLEVSEGDVLHEWARAFHEGKGNGWSRGNFASMEHRPEAPFGRVLTAIVTPFAPDGSIDYAAFWRLVRHLRDNGSNGIVVSGTTGESPTLSKPEKIALFKAAVDAAKGKMTVVAGAGTYDTRESISLAEAAANAGCDGIMAVTPYYSKPPQRGVAAHMRAIAGATDLPVMLYNIPGRTATKIEIDTLRELADHPKIVAVKDAVGDMEWTRNAIRAMPEGFAFYSGNDGDTKDIVAAGGVGVVSVTAHLAGREVAAMVDAVYDENWDLANELHELIDPLTHALFSEPSPMPLKAGLTAYWDSVGDPRLPLVAAEHHTVEAVGRALEAINEYRAR